MTSKQFVSLFVVLAAGILIAAGVWIWRRFHTSPSEAALRQAIETADEVEIFTLKADKFRHFVLLEDREVIRQLGSLVEFKQAKWETSTIPNAAVIIQTFRSGRRTAAWDLRNDGHFHIHKAGQWFRMPVNSEFERLARHVLADRGTDLMEANKEREHQHK